MRVTLLGMFAVLALVAGGYQKDGMILGLGVAAALGAAASWPLIRLPTFLQIMSELFAVETAVFGLVTLGVFLPEQMRLIPWTIVLRDIGLTNSLAGLVMIHTIQGLSFTVLFCRNYYIAIPQDLMKAAKIDGAGFFRIFWRIVAPLSPPIVIVTVIWQFTHIWNEFLYGVTFTTGTQQPVTAALIALSMSIADVPQHGVQSAAVVLAALPTLLVYLFGGRYFVRGLTAGAVK